LGVLRQTFGISRRSFLFRTSANPLARQAFTSRSCVGLCVGFRNPLTSRAFSRFIAQPCTPCCPDCCRAKTAWAALHTIAQKGISQEKLAERAGLHRTYVSSVERGQRNISILNIEKRLTRSEVAKLT
jgi:hypothetical protein